VSGLRIAFAGTPDFAVPALEALLGSTHTVVGVLTQPDRPKGRGRQIAASPVKARALAHGIPVSQPQTLKDEAGRAELVAWRPDALVVVAYGLILPRAVLTLPRLGCLNIHASLLPRWRGAAPIQRAILAGDTRTGVTIMLMDPGLDTGPMLLNEEVPIGPMDTGGSLHDRLAAVGASAVLEALDGHAQGTLSPVPQPLEGVTYAAKIDKAEAVIDWSQDALRIERQVRAFNPWPIAETRLEGEQLRVFEAVAEGLDERGWSPDAAPAGPDFPTSSSDQASNGGDHPKTGGQAGRGGVQTGGAEARAAGGADDPPGTILAVHDDALVVQCGRGRLALRQLQRPGRRAVAAGDFARGGLPLAGRHLG
jgi:methionyl-tRNA formyltransferase